ncbi:hypothetical protein LXL04_010711 [Taraxacum kok-saghyz]
MALDSVRLAGGKKTLEVGGFVLLVGGDASLNKGDRNRLKNTLGMIWVKVDVREKAYEERIKGTEKTEDVQGSLLLASGENSNVCKHCGNGGSNRDDNGGSNRYSNECPKWEKQEANLIEDESTVF